MLRRSLTAFLLLLLAAPFGYAAPPEAPKGAREIPPPGIEVPKDAKSALNKKRLELHKKVTALAAKKSDEIEKYLPDVEIFDRAVQLALEGNTFYSEGDIKAADKLLDTGLERVAELLAGQHSWTSQTGTVVRGYRSKLDGTVQPYGLVIGSDVKLDGPPVRCDIWFRGRAEKGLEVQFINERMTKGGEYSLQDGIILHPLGRYCNANRFAGEVDVFEALQHAKENYSIDPDRTAVSGFSMGGASTWGFTVHYPSKWFASYPGAGFSETFRFLGMDKNPDRIPAPYQQKLWNLYDANVLADNLFDVPTIAYSGEKDGQKMASDIMVEAAAKYGIEIPHIIGPDTAHKLHPDSKKIIAEQLENLAKKGRAVVPPSIRFTTYTLKYNNCAWITINGLGEHWSEAYVHADLVNPSAPTGVTVKTKNVTDLSLDFPEKVSPFGSLKDVDVTIDGQKIANVKTTVSKALKARFQLKDAKWVSVAPDVASDSLVKKHDLQGPVDDALMGPFLFVKPSGPYITPAIGAWVNSEMTRATKNWQRQMRGNARAVRDTEVSANDIRNNNLILWGCPKSNAVIKKIADKLPVEWSANELKVGAKQFDPAKQLLIMVYPNPLNPERYVVLNSSLTYREFDYENNARQTPKLPDWAIIDTSEAPNDATPGKIVEADFFDEQWKVKAAK